MCAGWSRLISSLRSPSGPPAGSQLAIGFADGMVTTWEPEESDGGTRLTCVQSGFDEARPAWLEVSVAGIPDGIITITGH